MANKAAICELPTHPPAKIKLSTRAVAQRIRTGELKTVLPAKRSDGFTASKAIYVGGFPVNGVKALINLVVEMIPAASMGASAAKRIPK